MKRKDLIAAVLVLELLFARTVCGNTQPVEQMQQAVISPIRL